jgi:hypothetical protein
MGVTRVRAFFCTGLSFSCHSEVTAGDMGAAITGVLFLLLLKQKMLTATGSEESVRDMVVRLRLERRERCHLYAVLGHGMVMSLVVGTVAYVIFKVIDHRYKVGYCR